MLDLLGGTVSNLDFQKLLFLYCHDSSSWQDPPYDFIPYKFGAFSFSSYADRRKLIERGLLCDDDAAWKISAAGKIEAQVGNRLQIAAFVKRHAGERGDRLVAKTYREFPYFATRSEIAPRVLKGDPKALARIDDAARVIAPPRLATIGYEGHSLESYLNKLLRSGITLLCDVRRNPLSRKYGFAKSTLAKGCDAVGIKYEHVPELGIASEERRELQTPADYQALFRRYEKSSLPFQAPSIAGIRTWVADGEHVALTCFEADPHMCHRHCVANAVARDWSEIVSTTHL